MTLTNKEERVGYNKTVDLVQYYSGGVQNLRNIMWTVSNNTYMYLCLLKMCL